MRNFAGRWSICCVFVMHVLLWQLQKPLDSVDMVDPRTSYPLLDPPGPAPTHLIPSSYPP